MTIDKALENIEESVMPEEKKIIVTTPNHFLPKDKLVASFDKLHDLRTEFFDDHNKYASVKRSHILDYAKTFDPYDTFLTRSFDCFQNITVEFERWIPIFGDVINSDALKDSGTNTKAIRPELKECIITSLEEEFKRIHRYSEKVPYNNEKLDWFERKIDNINNMHRAFYENDTLIDGILLGRGLNNYITNLVDKNLKQGNRLREWQKLKKAARNSIDNVEYEVHSNSIIIRKERY